MADMGAALGAGLQAALPQALSLGQMIKQSEHQGVLEQQNQERIGIAQKELGLHSELQAAQIPDIQNKAALSGIQVREAQEKENYLNKRIPLDSPEAKSFPMYEGLMKYGGHFIKTDSAGSKYVTMRDIHNYSQLLTENIDLAGKTITEQLLVNKNELAALDKENEGLSEEQLTSKKGIDYMTKRRQLEKETAWLQDKEEIVDKQRRAQLEKQAHETRLHAADKGAELEKEQFKQSQENLRHTALMKSNDKYHEAVLALRQKGFGFIGEDNEGHPVFGDDKGKVIVNREVSLAASKVKKGGTAANSGILNKIGGARESILQKIAKGETLTPGETEALSILNKTEQNQLTLASQIARSSDFFKMLPDSQSQMAYIDQILTTIEKGRAKTGKDMKFQKISMGEIGTYMDKAKNDPEQARALALADGKIW
jgi:hypothetical protein